MSTSCRLPGPALVHSLLTVALLVPSVPAQGTKLSGPLARPIGGDIRTAEFSPDGTRVVYVADQETDGVFELFVAKPNVPGLPVKLAGPSVEGGGVHPFEVWMGPKGQRLVFAGDLDTDGQTELYGVALAGGAAVKLNEPMAPNGDVRVGSEEVQIDQSETRVVWLANHDGDSAIELFSAPLTGGPVVKLNTPLAGFVRDVESFRISPDGTRVIYRADQELDNVMELFSVPITGGTPVRLNVAGRAVDAGYGFDASGTRVVFSALSGFFQQNQVYSAALDGHGTALPLLSTSVPNIGQILPVPGSALVLCTLLDNGPASSRLAAVPLDASGEQILETLPQGHAFLDVEVTPDGGTAFFYSRLGESAAFERVPVDGSAPATLIAEVIHSFEISPDGERVVYHGDAGLVSEPVDGSSAPVELTASAPFHPSSFAIAPDSERVVLRGFSGQEYELFSVPILGGKAPVRLNAPLPYGGSVESLSNARPFLLGALGHVVYLADQVEDGRIELFSAPIGGGKAPLRLNGELPIGPVEGDVLRFALSADGRHAVYTADDLVRFQLELFSVATDGRSDPVRLHEPLAAGEDAPHFALSPDGQTVVHWLTRAQIPQSELRAVPAGGGAPILLAGPFAGVRDGLLGIDPTNSWAVYTDYDNGMYTLESVPLDGSAPALTLASSFGFSRLVFTPDGTRLLCLADEDGNYAPGLMSVPLDGSAPAVHLESAGRVLSFTLAPDGTRALFVADSNVALQYEAFAAPVDGSAPALRLNPPLAPQASVRRELTAAGDFAFYLAPQDTLDKLELFRVPLDGSATSVKLNAPLVNRGNVLLFSVSPDGTRVVYHADQELDERFELYSVKSDGTGPVQKLNPPVGSGDVSGSNFLDGFYTDVFAISPDGTRVAFRADATVRDSLELLVAPIDGSAPAVRVSQAPSGSSSVLAAFRFSPDGRSLAYRTYSFQATSGPPIDFALFHAPVNGARPPKLVDSPGGVQPEFQWLPGSGRILYQHDSETRGVVELFTSTGRARPHDAPTRFVTRPR